MQDGKLQLQVVLRMKKRTHSKQLKVRDTHSDAKISRTSVANVNVIRQFQDVS